MFWFCIGFCIVVFMKDIKSIILCCKANGFDVIGFLSYCLLRGYYIRLSVLLANKTGLSEHMVPRDKTWERSTLHRWLI